MDIMKVDFGRVEARMFANQDPTKGDLQLIYSPKHPGDIFVKVRGTQKTFICKFYGGNSGISKAQAIINVHHFLECWDNHDKMLAEIESLKTELEKARRETSVL